MVARILTIALLCFAALFTTASPATADTSDFTFDSFDAEYTLSRAEDGSAHLEVVETIVARFPDFDQNRGLLRAIPLVNQGIYLEPEIHDVTDENGKEVYWEQQFDSEFTVLVLGTDDFVHGATTYVISYSLDNVVTEFSQDGADSEFYWDVNGTGWEQPFGRVSVGLTVDESAAEYLTGATGCYYGAFESDAECEITTDFVPATGTEPATAPARFTASVSDLDSGENLSIAVAFTANSFTPGRAWQEGDPGYDGGDYGEGYEPAPPLNDAPLWSSILAGVLGVGVASIPFFAGRQRSKVKKANAGQGIIVPQYSVPKGLNVMVAAHLVDRENTAFSAQLVSLAVRGKLRILDYPVTDSNADYTLQYLDSSDLDEIELALMNSLFGSKLEPGEVKELAPADVSLGNAVRAVTARAAQMQTSEGYRDQRQSSGCFFAGISMVAAFIVFAVLVVISITTYSVSPITIVAGIVAFLAIFVTFGISIGNSRGPLTRKGSLQREYLEGMKMYLELAEKERFRMLQSPDGAERIDVGDTKQIIKLYEKLLPFAVIWGVEDEWMQELVVHAGADETPDWFRSTDGFNAIAFSHALRGATTAATYTPPPPPSSSSWGGSGSSGSSFSSFSGGSSGGGFSGGGGGGGGGGGR
jgi:uncharacterized membrane protein YgcG